MDLFSRSWKTTWLGLTAGVSFVAPELWAWVNHQDVNWRFVFVGAALAAWGAVCRDKNVSSEQQGIPPAENVAEQARAIAALAGEEKPKP